MGKPGKTGNQRPMPISPRTCVPQKTTISVHQCSLAVQKTRPRIPALCPLWLYVSKSIPPAYFAASRLRVRPSPSPRPQPASPPCLCAAVSKKPQRLPSRMCRPPGFLGFCLQSGGLRTPASICRPLGSETKPTHPIHVFFAASRLRVRPAPLHRLRPPHFTPDFVPL
jgi:hypothetical protein